MHFLGGPGQLSALAQSPGKRIYPVVPQYLTFKSGSRPISRVLWQGISRRRYPRQPFLWSGGHPPDRRARRLAPPEPCCHLPASPTEPASSAKVAFGHPACLFGVAPDGGCRVSPAPFDWCDSSLWPSSSCRHAGWLSRIPLYGARTFLCPALTATGTATAWPTPDAILA